MNGTRFFIWLSVALVFSSLPLAAAQTAPTIDISVYGQTNAASTDIGQSYAIQAYFADAPPSDYLSFQVNVNGGWYNIASDKANNLPTKYGNSKIRVATFNPYSIGIYTASQPYYFRAVLYDHSGATFYYPSATGMSMTFTSTQTAVAPAPAPTTTSGSTAAAASPSASDSDYSACYSCASKSGMGWAVATAKCESGSVTGSTAGDAKTADKNWIYYTKTPASNPLGIYSCDDLVALKNTKVSSSTFNSNVPTTSQSGVIQTQTNEISIRADATKKSVYGETYYDIQLYTATALPDADKIDFQFQNYQGAWESLSFGPEAVGSLPIGSTGDSKSREYQFLASGNGLAAGSYLFRAIVYDSSGASVTHGPFYLAFSPAALPSGVSMTDQKPEITASGVLSQPGPTDRLTIAAGASDDFGLKSIEMFVDSKSVGKCSLPPAGSSMTVSRFGECELQVGPFPTVGSTHSFYAIATDTSGKWTASATNSFTVQSASAGGIVATAGAISYEGLYCNHGCIERGLGYDNLTQKCESGTPTQSSDTSASAANWHWFYYSSNAVRDAAVKSSPQYAGAHSCEELAPFINTGYTVTGSGTGGASGSGSGAAPAFDVNACNKCVANGGRGYATATGKCEVGTILKSSESSASVDSKNWVYFSVEAAKVLWSKFNQDASKGLSCENPTGAAASAPTTTTPPTASSQSCVSCTQQSLMGYVTTTGKCESGTTDRSDSGDAKTADKNWIYYTKTPAVNPFGAYSCDDLGTLSAAASGQGSGSGAGTQPVAATFSASDCNTCTAQPGKGYVTTTGKCETGTPLKSTEGTASTSGGNWVFYKTKLQVDALVSQHPEFSGAASCDSPQSGSGGAPSTANAAASASQNAQTAPSQSPVQACVKCTSQPSTGYNTANGACEKGTPLKSTESSASLGDKNWVFYSSENYKKLVTAGHPEFSSAASCDGVTSPVQSTGSPSNAAAGGGTTAAGGSGSTGSKGGSTAPSGTPASISVSTDKSKYTTSDTVLVSGSVSPGYSGVTVTGIVKRPGGFYSIFQSDTDSSGAYSSKVVLPASLDPSFKGAWTVSVQSSSGGSVAQTSMTVA